MLTKVPVDDCELWPHPTSIEDLYLMRKGDAMSNFVDVLFARVSVSSIVSILCVSNIPQMDTNEPWTDFHFPNSAFRDVVDTRCTPWIDPSLVRFSHRGGKDRAIDGLAVEYAVPFPLTYMFVQRVLQTYSSLFTFVLQIRRAQNALRRILV